MKTLILTRHGKSSWKYDVTDKQRPLKNRGIDDGVNVSEYLKDLDLKIDAVFSSPAKRAFTTCKIFMENLEIPDDKLKKVEDLYDFGGNSVIRVIKNVDNKYDTIIVFGHNHAFTNLVNKLGTENIGNLPTTGTAIIDFEIDSWRDINKGKTREIIIPKELRD